MAASQSDQYEVLAASVAAVQGQDPRVRTFAQEVIQEHTRLAEDLRKAAGASGLPPPELGMSSDQASLVSSLQSVRGPAFDKAYARQQELARAQAVAVEESFATAGSDPNLRKAAQSALPSIRDHLKKGAAATRRCRRILSQSIDVLPPVSLAPAVGVLAWLSLAGESRHPVHHFGVGGCPKGQWPVRRGMLMRATAVIVASASNAKTYATLASATCTVHSMSGRTSEPPGTRSITSSSFCSIACLRSSRAFRNIARR